MNRTKTFRWPALLTAAFCCVGLAQAGEFKAVGNSDPNHQARPYEQGEVVVTFDTMPTKVSFDLPGHIKLITENGIPYTNGATETYITSEGFHEGASYESWNDKDNKYSRMWIESQNDARIVVRHRCALIQGDKICHQDKRKVAPYGPGNWTDEWYIFHPDGTHTRRIKIWNAVARESGRHGAKYVYELEGMYLWWGAPCRGKMASDHLEDGMITLVKMDGSHKTIDLDPYPLKVNEFRKMGSVYGEFRDANIHVINTKSKYRPWRMGRWSRTLWVTPYVPVHKRVQLVPCFPSGTTRSSGYSAAGLGQMNWGDYWKLTDDSMSEIWLNGFTTSKEPAKDLAALARSWQNAPKMELTDGDGAVARGYSIGDRAYLIDATKPDRSREIHMAVSASTESPVINPAILINNWSTKNAKLSVDGAAVPRGRSFRMGLYRTLDLENGSTWTHVLVVWAKVTSTKLVRFTLRPAGDSLPKPTAPYRTWRSVKGAAIEARLVKDADGTVTLRKRTGKTIKVKRTYLSPEDRQYLDK
ncbi:hypothetical protein HQ560_07030, partial [bacterium]|nr:hypothetical protein [bacterium]